MSMVQAFGDVSLLCLGMMFPERHDIIPLENAGFRELPVGKILKIRPFVLRCKSDSFENPDDPRDASHSGIPPALPLKFLQGLGTFF